MKPKQFNYNLPKWPQMIVTGESVTIDQAKEIIFRTDDFFVSIDKYAGGNDRKFTETYQKASGINEILLENHKKIYEIQDHLMKKIEFIPSEYICNDWASSCYILGPHGWVHPNGKIGYYNIGKWPSVEEVYNDWCNIASAFPFLNLAATIMSDEYAAYHRKPIVSFIVSDGNVTVYDGSLEVHKNHEQYTKNYDHKSRNELGLP